MEAFELWSFTDISSKSYPYFGKVTLLVQFPIKDKKYYLHWVVLLSKRQQVDCASTDPEEGISPHGPPLGHWTVGRTKWRKSSMCVVRSLLSFLLKSTNLPLMKLPGFKQFYLSKRYPWPLNSRWKRSAHQNQRTLKARRRETVFQNHKLFDKNCGTKVFPEYVDPKCYVRVYTTLNPCFQRAGDPCWQDWGRIQACLVSPEASEAITLLPAFNN